MQKIFNKKIFTLILYIIICCSACTFTQPFTNEHIPKKFDWDDLGKDKQDLFIAESILKIAATQLLDINELEKMEFDTIAHYALASLYCNQRNNDPQYLKAGQFMLSYLLQNSDLNNDGLPGWGLRVEFDAFQDGTINPDATPYVYTTLKVAKVIIEMYKITGDEQYLDILNDISIYLIEKVQYWQDKDGHICFYYDEMESDHLYNVHNTNAMVMEFFITLDELTNSGKHKTYYDSIFLYLADTQKESGNWKYEENAEKDDSMNDLVHHAMIVSALDTGFRVTGNKKYKEIADKARTYMIDNHIDANYKFYDDDINKRGWGIGEFLVIVKDEVFYENLLKNIYEELDEEFIYSPSASVQPFGVGKDRWISWFAYGMSFSSNDN